MVSNLSARWKYMTRLVSNSKLKHYCVCPRALKSLSRGRVDGKECVCLFSTSELAQTKHWTWAGINFLTSSQQPRRTGRYLITARHVSWAHLWNAAVQHSRGETRASERGCMKYAKISICKLTRDHLNSAERSERDPLGERRTLWEMRRFLIYYLTRRAGNDEKKNTSRSILISHKKLHRPICILLSSV